MDHTLNKLYESYSEYYKNLFGKDLNLTREGLSTYYIHEITGPNKSQERERKYQIFNTPGFWENIPIYNNAAKVMEKLNKEHDVFIVTAPWTPAEGCYLEKKKWVEKYLPFFDIDKIIYTKHKYLLNGDIIIDDCPEHLINNRCRWQIKIWYPFNEHIPGLDAATWNDVATYINNIKVMEKKYGRIN
jgi:5'(3')-deoxyribonucleotidase